jgi:hypothetical protein
MSINGSHAIETVAQLREVIGESLEIMETLKGDDRLNEESIDFIGRAPFLVLSTASADGQQDASPKGDGPGFVVVEDERTIVIPDRPGNKLAYGLENILQNSQVGLLFLVPGTPETLRINGRAELTRDPALLQRMAARGKPALLGIRVTVEECFFHCAKAFLRSNLWKPDTWQERVRVSFGRMAARKLGADSQVADAIDKAVDEDYRTNL